MLFEPHPHADIDAKRGVHCKSWSLDQFPRNSSPCINGIAMTADTHPGSG